MTGLWAWSLESLGGGALPVKVLAVLGGAVLGGLALGMIGQMLTRLLTAHTLPRWPLFAVRLGGAVVAGWLVWTLFGVGGWGLGGPGGGGVGQPGGGERKEGTKPRGRGTSEKPELSKEAEPPPADVFRVEVLGNEPLRAVGGPKAKLALRYRVGWPDRPHYYSLEEVKERILRRIKEDPPLRGIEIVVYEDSPAPDGPAVSQLRTWAEELEVGGRKVQVDVKLPGRNAPVKGGRKP